MSYCTENNNDDVNGGGGGGVHNDIGRDGQPRRPRRHPDRRHGRRADGGGGSLEVYRRYDCAPSIEEFVYQYYGTLERAPHETWRHYAADAQYMHVDGDAATDGCHMKPAVGHHQINANVVHQQFVECKFNVRTVNVQRAPAAYLVLATGDVARGPGPAVVFVQSFLVDFVHGIGQFVISNSILKVYTA